MSELLLVKGGGTSNSNAENVTMSMGWACEADISVESAPGRLVGVNEPYGDKVTDTSLAIRDEYISTGEITDQGPDVVTERFAEIVNGLGREALPSRTWLSDINPRIKEAARHSYDAVSMMGERLIAEIYVAMLGLIMLDPGRAPHDLGSDMDSWRGWMGSILRPGQKYILLGNTTLAGGHLTTFSRGGSDTGAGYGAYGAQAAMHYNLTNGCAKTADPDLIDINRLHNVSHIPYVVGRELGRNGTGLMHPAAMVPLMNGNIPTEIRSTFNRGAPFTTLDNDLVRAERSSGRITALSMMEDVVVHRIHEPGMAEAVGRLAAFEQTFADQGIAVMDSQGDGVDAQKYFVESKDADQAAAILRAATKWGTVESSDALSFITLAGYMLERRYLDNIIGIALNSGIIGKEWQGHGYPISNARHSLRIGLAPEDAREILSNIHRIAIESQFR